jgi:hypothetical protein
MRCYAGWMNACDASCVSDLMNASRVDLIRVENYFLNSIPSTKRQQDWFIGKNNKKVELLINFTVYTKLICVADIPLQLKMN